MITIDTQSLEYAQCAETELSPQHGEEAIKECSRPANFGQSERDDLEDDQEAIYNRPENTTNLIRDGAVPMGNVSMRQAVLVRHLQNVFAVDECFTGGSIACLLGRVIGVHSFDVGDNDKDAACKDKQKGHDAQHADSIETKENVWMKDESRVGWVDGKHVQVRMGAMMKRSKIVRRKV